MCGKQWILQNLYDCLSEPTAHGNEEYLQGIPQNTMHKM